jgi:D-alanine transaminase/branched-chain amino acid aminotransferase
MNTRIAFFNNSFIEEEKVFLHVSDLAIQRGYGVFDFFKVVNDVPLFMHDHLDRLFNSAAGLGLEPGLNKTEIASIAQGLINRNKIPYSGIKIILTGGYSQDGYNPATPNLIITQQQMLPRPAGIFEKGFKVITFEHVRELPEIKSINYTTGVLLQQKLTLAGADDVLYHKNGEISEFPRSNFFIVMKNDKVVTPSKNILRGITRKKTLELARKHFTAEEVTVTLDDIRNAKEAFITSTSKEIIPVVMIDDIVINNGKPGEVTRFLDTKFAELCHNSPA